MHRYTALLLSLIVFYSCSTKTTVILLPEEDGTTGSVIVKNESSAQTIDVPYTSASVSSEKGDIAVNPVKVTHVTQEYQDLLKSEPAKPVHYILYFEHDSANLTQDSMALIPEILRVAKEREPSQISVIGHTDSSGSDVYNSELALERAEMVAVILKKSDVTLMNLTIKSHGENDPLVITDNDVSE